MFGGDLFARFFVAQVCIDKCLKDISTITPISIKKNFLPGRNAAYDEIPFVFERLKDFAKE